jgi:hypothetical protein
MAPRGQFSMARDSAIIRVLIAPQPVTCSVVGACLVSVADGGGFSA